MKIKTSELKGKDLDLGVAVCLGHKDIITDFGVYIRIKTQPAGALTFCPSTDWALGGLIIEREKISLEWMSGAGDAGADVWVATRYERPGIAEEQGPTPLVAAMRCFVASRLGDEVDITNVMKGDK